MKTLKDCLGRAAWLRALVVVMSGLFVLSSVDAAYAAGTVKWKSTTIEERTKNESWNLEMEIHLAQIPDIAHQAMKFEFTQISEYERSLVDGREDPQERTVPLSNQEALIESVTVGFMDPGSGKVQKRTRFSFKVTRAHGYKAGQWKVKIRSTETGQQIGSEATLTFKGENPVVDRRSISFEGKPKAKKEEKEEPTESPSEDPSQSSDSSSDGDGEDFGPAEDEGQTPPSVDERPGGGCHHTPWEVESPWTAWLLMAAFGGLVWSRRKS
jgi:hypothetical protein